MARAWRRSGCLWWRRVGPIEEGEVARRFGSGRRRTGRKGAAGEADEREDEARMAAARRWRRNRGRTPCKYRGKNIAFRVVEGSTSFWLSLLVEFEDGDGDIGSMQLKQAKSTDWQDMKHIWGATWSVTPGPLVGPFSIRVTTLTTKKTLSAQDVIPRNWTPKATYTSRLNFA
ncbi:hypothetical protein ZWY2020_021236 [Hordeum vulgare]|nr:hypothetical protein ZWY2020_021236 [Hordeum vulgare]